MCRSRRHLYLPLRRSCHMPRGKDLEHVCWKLAAYVGTWSSEIWYDLRNSFAKVTPCLG